MSHATAIANSDGPDTPATGHDGATAYPWAAHTYPGYDAVDNTTYTVTHSTTHTVHGIEGANTVLIQHDQVTHNGRPHLYLNAAGPATPEQARDYAAAVLYAAARAEGRDTNLCCKVSDNCPHVTQTEREATRDIARIRKNGNAPDIMRRIANAAHHRHNGHNKPAN